MHLKHEVLISNVELFSLFAWLHSRFSPSRTLVYFLTVFTVMEIFWVSKSKIFVFALRVTLASRSLGVQLGSTVCYSGMRRLGTSWFSCGTGDRLGGWRSEWTDTSASTETEQKGFGRFYFLPDERTKFFFNQRHAFKSSTFICSTDMT